MSFKRSVPPYFKVPKMLVKGPRLTIAQISRRTSMDTKKKSRIVAIQKVSEGRVPKALEGYTCYKAQTKNTKNGNRYKIAIYSKDKKITKESKVIIDSPNPLAVFRFEVALAKRGNAFIHYSNGDHPIKTNPGLVPGMDHHVFKFLSYLVRNTNKSGLRRRTK